MEVLIVVLIVACLISLWLNVQRQRPSPAKEKPSEYKYIQKSELVSPAELSFYKSLIKAIGDEYIVLAKVRVADILAPEVNKNRSEWLKSFNQISNKHFDFVLCKPRNLEPIAAIELDDASHQQVSAIKRDKIKTKATETAGFPLIRIKVKQAYSISGIREPLSTVLQTQETVVPDTESNMPSTTLNESAPSCPKCGSTLVPRISKKGKHAGRRFFGCSQFPACRTVILDNVQNPAAP